MAASRFKRALFLAGVAGVAIGAVLFVCLTAKDRRRPRAAAVDRGPSPAARRPVRGAAARGPQAAARPAMQPRRSARAVAHQPVDAGLFVEPTARSGSAAAVEDTTAARQTRRRLSRAARVEQRRMYREQLALLPRQIARLRATIARLRGRGAPADVVESVERRLQQLIEARARMERHLRTLEASSR